MPDMLVHLYKHDWNERLVDDKKRLSERGVKVLRALAPDREPILRFVAGKMNEGYVGEAAAALSNNPPTLFVAMRGGDPLGIACYDATAKGYFGPIELVAEARGQGVGTALLDACMNAMKEDGYGYAIIGWATSARDFYKKTVGAVDIEDWSPSTSVYGRFSKVG